MIRTTFYPDWHSAFRLGVNEISAEGNFSGSFENSMPPTPLATSMLDLPQSPVAMEYLASAGGVGQAMNLSDEEVESSTAKMLPELGQVFRDAVHEAEDGLSGLSASLQGLKQSADSLAIALAIAEAAFLAYCYSNHNRQRVAEFDESLFSDGEPIQMDDANVFAF